MKAMFTAVYSDMGTWKRQAEEQTYIYFSDFLDECECEGMDIIMNPCYCNTYVNCLIIIIMQKNCDVRYVMYAFSSREQANLHMLVFHESQP